MTILIAWTSGASGHLCCSLAPIPMHTAELHISSCCRYCMRRSFMAAISRGAGIAHWSRRLDSRRILDHSAGHQGRCAHGQLLSFWQLCSRLSSSRLRRRRLCRAGATCQRNCLRAWHCRVNPPLLRIRRLGHLALGCCCSWLSFLISCIGKAPLKACLHTAVSREASWWKHTLACTS